MAKKKATPSIDERLKALVDRHEALTESVELLMLTQRQTTLDLDRLERLFRFVGTSHNKRITKLERKVF